MNHDQPAPARCPDDAKEIEDVRPMAVLAEACRASGSPAASSECQT